MIEEDLLLDLGVEEVVEALAVMVEVGAGVWSLEVPTGFQVLMIGVPLTVPRVTVHRHTVCVASVLPNTLTLNQCVIFNIAISEQKILVFCLLFCPLGK